MNIENIQKIIARLKADDGSHFKMKGWAAWLPHIAQAREADENYPTEFVECGTAFCIGGWANMLRDEASAKTLKGAQFESFIQDEETAARWIGISYSQAQRLFRMENSDLGLLYFDRLPQAVRRQAGINVLELLIETGGSVDWDQAIEAAERANPPAE